MSLTHFKFLGTSYEQGLAHGECLKESIQKNIEVYISRFQTEACIKKSDLLSNTSIYLDVLRKQSPEYVRGMIGISESSNISLLEISMLNLRYELFYHALGKRYLQNSVDGCTSFAINPNNMVNKNLVMGQNWDWIPEIDCALITSIDEDGLQRISFTEAGIYGGKPGMNSAGIGLAVNGMHSMNDDWRRLKKPFHVRCYEILRSINMENALKTLTESPRSCTANFILGQTPSQFLNIELSPDKINLIHPNENILVHANHFNDPNSIGIIEPPNPRRHFSEFRNERLFSLLKNYKKLTISNIKTALSDHKNHPQSICRHIDENLSLHEQTITKTAMIMDLNDRMIWLTNGQPCKNSFEKHQINKS